MHDDALASCSAEEAFSRLSSHKKSPEENYICHRIAKPKPVLRISAKKVAVSSIDRLNHCIKCLANLQKTKKIIFEMNSDCKN